MFQTLGTKSIFKPKKKKKLNRISFNGKKEFTVTRGECCKGEQENRANLLIKAPSKLRIYMAFKNPCYQPNKNGGCNGC